MVTLPWWRVKVIVYDYFNIYNQSLRDIQTQSQEIMQLNKKHNFFIDIGDEKIQKSNMTRICIGPLYKI